MMFNKRGSQYLLYILITSILLGLFLTFLLNSTILKVDNTRCNDISYEISRVCVHGERIEVTIKNLVTTGFYFDSERGSFFVSTDDTEKNQKFYIFSEDRVVEIIPYFSSNVENIYCNGKKKVVEVFEKC